MKRAYTGEVRLVRGGLVESVHRVHAVVTDAEGRVLASCGDPEHDTLLRSAAKPFQALPLVEDGALEAFGFGARELAIACGSHGGEPGHLSLVGEMLVRAGIVEDALACGPHAPMHGASARALAATGSSPRPIHNNCSGKHAAMLALARHHGWPLDDYHVAEHPVQVRMAAEVARWTGCPEDDLGRGVDGCGVVCFSAPLHALARGYAALMAGRDSGDPGPAAVLGAMIAHPFLVAGTGRLCTALIEAGEGSIVAKVGAEGVYGAAVRLPSGGGRGGSATAAEPTVAGIAVKVEDGSRRAAEVALVAVLDAIADRFGGGGVPPRKALPDRLLEAAGPWRRPPVPNTRGEAVAHLEPHLALGWRPRGTRSALRPGMRVLVRAAAAQAARDPGGLERELQEVSATLDAGDLSDLEVEEALLQSYLFLGYPSAMEALARWRRFRSRPGVGGVHEPPERWEQRGPEVFRRVYGAQVGGLRRNVAALHPEMDRWMVVEGYGKVLGRPGLPLRDRELLVIAVLAVQDTPRQLHSHLRGALRNGASAAEIDALLGEIDGWFPDRAVREEAWETWRAVRARHEGRPEDDGPATEPEHAGTERGGNDVH